MATRMPSDSYQLEVRNSHGQQPRHAVRALGYYSVVKTEANNAITSDDTRYTDGGACARGTIIAATYA